MQKTWFGYIYGDPFSTESYYKITEFPVFSSGSRLGSIYTKGDDTRPNEFSSDLKTMIANALATGISQSNKKGELIVSMLPQL